MRISLLRFFKKSINLPYANLCLMLLLFYFISAIFWLFLPNLAFWLMLIFSRTKNRINVIELLYWRQGPDRAIMQKFKCDFKTVLVPLCSVVSTVFLVAYLCIFVNNNGDNQLPTQKRCQSNMPIWFVWFYCLCSVMDKFIMVLWVILWS